jgi:CubicO group peptidase (beta-lactamase class C family)
MLRRVVLCIIALLLVVIGIYGWALLSTDRSAIARALVWMGSDVGDQHRFPARRIPAPTRPSPLPARPDLPAVGGPPDAFLRDTGTLGFLVVHHDRIVDERYFNDSGRRSLVTSWSVAKSFVSTLVGIAIDEGFVGSVDEPVTDYVPELAARDRRFTKITLRDLLTMSSGLRYSETTVLGIPWPWRDPTYTYYGVDLRKVALEHTQIARAPGEQWHYTNYNPLLLGLVLERATGMSVSDYMATRLWQPLGAEADATWNLDSKRSGFEKLESGINARAADYARLGLLFLHRGEWNGTRVVSEAWVRAATAPHARTEGENLYGYFWWIDGERPGRFYAWGDHGQYIYVAPDADAVIVRFGRDYGVNNLAWLATFRAVADKLKRGRQGDS